MDAFFYFRTLQFKVFFTQIFSRENEQFSFCNLSKQIYFYSPYELSNKEFLI